MRKVVLLMGVLALMANVARADLIGSWAKEAVNAELERWVLTITPTAGEIMTGFDLSVSDPNYPPYVPGGEGPGIFENSGVPIKSGTASAPTYPVKDMLTDFLLYKKHGTVADLLTINEGVDDTELYGAITRTGGGKYGAGWSSALELLEVIVPIGTYLGDVPGLVVLGSLNAEGTGFTAVPLASITTGAGYAEIHFIPEPSSIVLLGCGLFGLLAYAWRKRK